jgi:hypothetical protein
MPPPPYRCDQVSFHQINSPLLASAHNVASQCGEDGVIQKIFEIIGLNHKYCVEFGAWDGKYMSNCYNLVANKGWAALFIEGNQEKHKDLVATHGSNRLVACLHRFVDFDGENSLDNILASQNAPQDFDLLSIDVDGTDYFIWESVRKHRPSVVVIEFNPTVPNDIIFIQAKDNSVNQGCSLLALVMLGKEKGYELVCCTGWNAFFVASEHFHKFDIPSNHINLLYRPAQDGRIFHGYDSHIYTIGMDRLMWSGVRVSSEDFQVMPASLRRFGDSQR